MLFLATFVAYVAVRSGTQPVASFLRANPRSTSAQTTTFQEANGLRSGFAGFLRGYFHWLQHLVGSAGSWPRSIRHQASVGNALREATFNSLRLAVVATLIGVTAGLALAALGAKRPGGILDGVIGSASAVMLTIPVLVVGLAFQLVFASKMTLFPLGGLYEPGQRGFDPIQMLKYIALPALTIAFHSTVGFSRSIRPVFEGLRPQKSPRPRSVVSPVLAAIGPQVGSMLGALFIAENIFDYPGIGRYFVLAATDGDLPKLMPLLFSLVIALILVQFLVRAGSGRDALAAAPRGVWPRISRRSSIVVVAAVVIGAVAIAPLFARFGFNEHVVDLRLARNQNLKPSGAAWLGSDAGGFDIFSRIIYGIRGSLLMGFAAAVLSVVIGSVVGAVSGRCGPLLDAALQRGYEFFSLIPALVVLILLRGVLGSVGWVTSIVGDPFSLRFFVVLFALVGWVPVARAMRASTGGAADGSSVPLRTSGRLAVSLIPTLIACAMVAESTLSFLRLGPGDRAISLGRLFEQIPIAVGTRHWWIVVFPSAALAGVAIALHGVGHLLADADPKVEISVLGDDLAGGEPANSGANSDRILHRA